MAREIVVDLWDKKVALFKESFAVQLQIENDHNDTFIDLNEREVRALRDSLDSWLKEKEVSNVI